MWIFARFQLKAWHLSERWCRHDSLNLVLADRTWDVLLAFSRDAHDNVLSRGVRKQGVYRISRSPSLSCRTDSCSA
jgi:hypothetical protein